MEIVFSLKAAVSIAMSWFLSNGKKLTYSGDTALSDCVLEKAQGADVLIHDVVGTSAYYMLASSHTLCDQLSEQLERYQIKCLLPVHRLTRYKDDISDYLEELESNFSGDVMKSKKVRYNFLHLSIPSCSFSLARKQMR